MKSRYLRLFSWTFVVLLFQSSLLPASEKNDLKYKMDGTFRYKMSATIVTFQEMMGSEIESDSKFSGIARLISEGRNAQGNIQFTLQNESLEIVMSSPQIDSTLKNPEGLVGRRVQKTVTPYGDQITSTEIDSFVVPPFLPGFTSEQEFLPNLPPEPIAAGENTEIVDLDTTHNFGGQNIVKSEIKYTLVGPEKMLARRCVKLDFDGKINLEGDGNFNGMSLFFEGFGTTKGSIHFDPEAGIMVDWQNKTEIEMTIAITGQQNMTIPTRQTIENHVELIE